MSQRKLVRNSLVIGAVVSALLAPVASGLPMPELGKDIGQAMQSSLNEARNSVADELRRSIAMQVNQALGLSQAKPVNRELSMVRQNANKADKE